ncbi:metalloregulator ArsR/SmtB family transcription factor [Methanolobus sp. WCC4]|uniref:ArsR/SmtB family transcription factor n=1 Tax=Methanolobus sp. WCC4 TaxID=3125784 RepID=UPI0030F5A955
MRCCPEDPVIRLMWEEEMEQEKVMSPEAVESICQYLKVLANPTRLRIAYLLSERDHCVCELIYKIEQKQNLISHHLSVMKKNGIIESYNQSKWKYYRLSIDVSPVLDLFGEDRKDRA